jgi:hypothetical protein
MKAHAEQKVGTLTRKLWNEGTRRKKGKHIDLKGAE